MHPDTTVGKCILPCIMRLYVTFSSLWFHATEAPLWMCISTTLKKMWLFSKDIFRIICNEVHLFFTSFAVNGNFGYFSTFLPFISSAGKNKSNFAKWLLTENFVFATFGKFPYEESFLLSIWSSFIRFHLQSWQKAPVTPGGQSHLKGATQLPPFWQPGWQKARRNKQLSRTS